ncbi:class C sortase [Collinsella sp. AF08-23]|uniref:class C sortase n=1 Tax=Collinsella sp. AF08-23 TaxID=2292211 RepID=UPI000E51D1DC|nr:class C sortase [Collinsella sp. AF08-23]RHS39158.1 class C sortase [Collinsella sp. AF08-23]
MKKSRDWFSTLAIIGGLLLVLYPTISNFLNLRNATRVIEQYSEAVDELTDDEAQQLMDAARTYNAKLAGLSGIPAADGGWDAIDASLAAQLREEYMGLLDLTGTGVMGYITIPRLDETMPIYHTTEEKVLQVATGHIETSSLPVGGASTHAAISGHRGLPSAKLFTELDKMQLGDIFYVRVLKETFAYQVDQILTVLPEETEALAIEPGADYMTLVTCTPYGINSHRLLVRAHAIPFLPSMLDEVGVMGSPINLSWPHLALIAGLILAAIVLASLRLRQVQRRDGVQGGTYGNVDGVARRRMMGKEDEHEHGGRHFA